MDGQPRFFENNGARILELGHPWSSLVRLDADEKGVSQINTPAKNDNTG